MSLTVFLAVLAAALAHASWNAMVKVRLDRFASMTLMFIGMGVFALPVLFLVPVPEGVTWLYILASMAFHTGYRWFLVKAYETGDLAQAYPLARGTAPLLTTLGAVVLLAELPTPLTIAGIALLSLGTLSMSFKGGDPTAIGGRAVAYALITSLFVASYTLSDGAGARSAASATSYIAWLYVLDAIWCVALALMLRGPRIVSVMAPEWKTGALTGALAGVKGSNYSIGLDSVREGVAEAWPSLELFVDGMDLLRLVFETVEPAAERLKARCYENFSTATDLADALVRRYGIAFREAHHIVGGAVQMALDAGLDASGLDAAIVERSAEREIGRRLDLDDAFVRASLDPVASVASRTTPGGTAPSEVRRVLAVLETRRHADGRLTAERRRTLAAADARLRAAVAALSA